jgi:tRNA(Arg) A34 adenosine deaminase TadA
MHYELFMGAALGEARTALEQGERPHGAAAVLGEALVASAHEEVGSRGDPTAHAVVLTLREAAKRLGTRSLAGVTVFATVEPCAMCVGALLEADADCLVYALANTETGAAGSVVQLANHPALPRRVDLVSGILRADAAELLQPDARRPA